MSAQCPVVLVGLPGAGKSKVGRLLAERLCVDHIDTDALVVEREGRPIADIFATDGEAAFRVMETEVVADALTHDAVVSLGGGAAATPAVRELLSGHTVVYIDASHEELVRRTASKTHRPLLADDPSGTLARLRTEREPHYRSVATIVVESGSGPVDDVVTAIAQQLEHA
nr:shikimate kinase [Schaalia odontolytica]